MEFNEMTTFGLYIAVFAFSLGMVYVSNRVKKKISKNICLILSLVPLWLLNIFRATSVGADTPHIGRVYTAIVDGDQMSGYDWFWLPLRAFCKIIGFIFGNDPFWIIAAFGTLFMVFLFLFLKDNKDSRLQYLILIIVFGFYLQSFNQSRQMLALMIVLYASKFIESGSIVKYIIAILFAAVFHESSLVFIPLYFLKNLKFNKSIVWAYVVITFLLLISNGLLAELLKYTKYYIYFTSQYNVALVPSAIINTAVRIVMLIFCLKYKNKIPNNKLNNFSYHMIFICTMLQVLTLRYYFIGRLTTYFYAFYIILLPQCIAYVYKHIKKKNKKVLFGIAVVALLVSYFVVYYLSGTGASGSGYDVYQIAITQG